MNSASVFSRGGRRHLARFVKSGLIEINAKLLSQSPEVAPDRVLLPYRPRRVPVSLQGCWPQARRIWRELGFPNLVRARAAYAKIRAERRRQEAAKRFSPFAVASERYEDLAPPPKPSRPRRKQVYKSRVVGKYQQE